MAFFTRDHENEFSRQYDTDGSGEIEFPEFCNMMSQKMSQQDDAEMVKLVIYDDGENDNLMMAFWAFLPPPFPFPGNFLKLNKVYAVKWPFG